MDQDEAYRRIWQRFRTYRTLEDGRHDTAEWRAHDGVFAGCLIRVPPATVDRALSPLRDELATSPVIRVHPPHFLHIMLQELGFVCDRPQRADEITPSRFDEIVAAAAAPVAEQEPFRIALGGANSFQDAIFLDVHDLGRCARLHVRLFDVAAIPRAPRFAYLPHTTIAHYTAAAPATGLAGMIARWRDHRFGSFIVNQVEFVTLRLDEPYPPLEPYAVIPLGG